MLEVATYFFLLLFLSERILSGKPMKGKITKDPLPLWDHRTIKTPSEMMSFLKEKKPALYLCVLRTVFLGFPGSAFGKESTCQCRRHRDSGLIPGFWKIPWKRKWHPTPVFLPGKFHGQKSLVGYSPWGKKSQLQLST